MFEPVTGESVAVTSQNPGLPFASATHLPLALVAPNIDAVTAEHLSAPARAGKLEALGPSAVCDAVQPAIKAASATEASNLMASLSSQFSSLRGTEGPAAIQG